MKIRGLTKRNRKTFETTQRDKRIYDARLSGKSAMQIAIAENVDISTVHRVLKAASTVAESREALAAHNYGRLEDIIRSNYPAMQGRDHDATNAVIRAIEAQNKMLGIGAGGTTINIGSREETISGGLKVNLKGLDVEFVHSPLSDQPDEPGPRYSAKVLPHPRLVEATANEPKPATMSDDIKPDAIPPEQIGRPGFPKGMTEAPSNPMRRQRAESFAAGDVNDQSRIAQNPSGLRTEFDIPNVADRFGFGTADSRVFPAPPPRKIS
jgi:hypothetical protein